MHVSCGFVYLALYNWVCLLIFSCSDVLVILVVMYLIEDLFIQKDLNVVDQKCSFILLEDINIHRVYKYCTLKVMFKMSSRV